MERAKRSTDSFATLYQQYNAMVRAVVYNICGAEHLDDIVQDVFVRIWKGIAGFDNRSSLKTWIYRVAVNAALDHCRRAGRRPGEVEIGDEIRSAENHEKSAMASDLVKKGLEILSPEHRAVLVLHIMEGIPIKEIAEITNISEGTIKSRLHSARKKILEFFEANGVKL